MCHSTKLGVGSLPPKTSNLLSAMAFETDSHSTSILETVGRQESVIVLERGRSRIVQTDHMTGTNRNEVLKNTSELAHAL